MKKNLLTIGSTFDTTAGEAPQRRFQIYRQGQAGNFTPGFSSDSAAEIVEAFLSESPAFDGGEMHIWNHRTQKVSASVQWPVSRTEFGFPVRHRADAFYDGMLAGIARRIHEREAIRESIQQSVRMGV